MGNVILNIVAAIGAALAAWLAIYYCPPPLAARTYSGRFMVRVPPETHRFLVLQAAEAGVSLNRLVSARLSGAP